MYVTKELLLSALPPYQDRWQTVKGQQEVSDIISEMLSAHTEFERYYDCIGGFFEKSSLKAVCRGLYDFCKDNIRYSEEPESLQTVSLPTGILERGHGDCKAYASFIGGCLGAIERLTGEPIDWYYCFASYMLEQRTPYHVFIVVNDDDGRPIWVDPTPGAEGKIPVWVINEKVKKSIGAVSGVGQVGLTLLPPPSWYPSFLPKFYRADDSDGSILLRPLGAVPKYSNADILDTLLYLQMYMGYGRPDWQNAFSVAWFYYTKGPNAKAAPSAYSWVRSAFKADQWGDGGGNFANVSPNGRGIDGELYSELQQRFLQREASKYPWLVEMQKKGGGIDLGFIPKPTDVEQARPSFYPDYLPSLFKSAGGYFDKPAGFLTTKPMLLNFKSSGYTQYDVTATDIANLMLYAQPIIAAGPTPYPVNWYINDAVNGAQVFYHKITLAFGPGHTDSEIQEFGIKGDLMKPPDLHADPYASNFTKALELIVKSVFTKIPGTGQLFSSILGLASAGGMGITAGESPAGTFSKEVFDAADGIASGLQQQDTGNKKTVLVFGLVGVAMVLVWYFFINKHANGARKKHSRV